MVDVLLFHHAQGLTDGVVAFADRLRAAGHRVTVPDLYDGATFGSVEDGVAHAEHLGFESIIAVGVAVAETLPDRIVYAGFSLGALPAQKLAQTRHGASGALIFHGDVPFSTFGEAWPAGVDLQVHTNDNDPWCELGIVEDLVENVGEQANAELFLYPGSTHLFTDSSLPVYHAASAELVMQRTLEFLHRVAAD